MFFFNVKKRLLRAVKEQDIDVVERLLGKGVDPNGTDDEGNSLLMLAIENENRFIVEALMAVGADVHHLNNYDQHALSFAAKTGKREFIDLMLAFQLDPHQRDILGMNARVHAVSSGHRALDAFFADKNVSGRWPLQLLYNRNKIALEITAKNLHQVRFIAENVNEDSLQVLIIPGTVFYNPSPSQDLAVTEEISFTLGPGETTESELPVACLNAAAPSPSQGEAFIGVRLSSSRIIRLLTHMHAMPPMAKQAAVWALTNDFGAKALQLRMEHKEGSEAIGAQDIEQARQLLDQMGFKHQL